MYSRLSICTESSRAVFLLSYSFSSSHSHHFSPFLYLCRLANCTRHESEIHLKRDKKWDPFLLIFSHYIAVEYPRRRRLMMGPEEWKRFNEPFQLSFAQFPDDEALTNLHIYQIRERARERQTFPTSERDYQINQDGREV